MSDVPGVADGVVDPYVLGLGSDFGCVFGVGATAVPLAPADRLIVQHDNQSPRRLLTDYRAAQILNFGFE
jgi:hypothetical protein